MFGLFPQKTAKLRHRPLEQSIFGKGGLTLEIAGVKEAKKIGCFLCIIKFWDKK